MYSVIRSRHNGAGVRRGFTLIELLLVIAIIAVLGSLSAAAAIRFVASQKTANTRTLLSRTGSRLQQQVSWVLDQGRKETVTQTATNMANGSTDRARIIHMKLKMKQYFPVSFAEAANPPSGYPVVQGYASYLATYGPPAGLTASEESSACLYMILGHGPNTTGEDDLGVSSMKTNNKGIPLLVDGWGNPLTFSRWPVGDSSAAGKFASGANPAGYQTGFNDPQDPQGLLTANSWLKSSGYSSFMSICHPLPPRSGGKANSVNLTPVIVSNGLDGQLGMNPATLQVTNQGQANDNLYSSNLP